jgi:hypothetical protein
MGDVIAEHLPTLRQLIADGTNTLEPGARPCNRPSGITGPSAPARCDR